MSRHEVVTHSSVLSDSVINQSEEAPKQLSYRENSCRSRGPFQIYPLAGFGPVNA
jgi:hypothetical protein